MNASSNMFEIISIKDKLFHIKETSTEQIIHSVKTRKEAGRFVKRFKNGGGFFGHTPMFFLKKAEIKLAS